MKKKLIIITTLFVCNLANGQLKVFSSGNMSVGTTIVNSNVLINNYDAYSFVLYGSM